MKIIRRSLLRFWNNVIVNRFKISTFNGLFKFIHKLVFDENALKKTLQVALAATTYATYNAPNNYLTLFILNKGSIVCRSIEYWYLLFIPSSITTGTFYKISFLVNVFDRHVKKSLAKLKSRLCVHVRYTFRINISDRLWSFGNSINYSVHHYNYLRENCQSLHV